MDSYIGNRPVSEAVGFRKEWLAAAGQTTFGVTYLPGYLDVFVNGVRLGAADFTATDGLGFVLAKPAAENDVVAAIAWAKGEAINFVDKGGDTMTGPLTVQGLVDAQGGLLGRAAASLPPTAGQIGEQAAINVSGADGPAGLFGMAMGVHHNTLDIGYTKKCELTLSPGVWSVFGIARFATNISSSNTNTRQLSLRFDGGSSTQDRWTQQPFPPGYPDAPVVYIEQTRILTLLVDTTLVLTMKHDGLAASMSVYRENSSFSMTATRLA